MIKRIKIRFQCGICLKLKLPFKRFKNKERSCRAHSFCKQCMAMHIISNLSHDIPEIGCPALGCNAMLDAASCRHLISQSLFVKWCDMLLRWETDDDGDFQDGYGDHDHCHQHCSKRKRCRDGNDCMFKQLVVAKKWKRCPKCKFFVERVSGCSSIVCRLIGTVTPLETLKKVAMGVLDSIQSMPSTSIQHPMMKKTLSWSNSIYTKDSVSKDLTESVILMEQRKLGWKTMTWKKFSKKKLGDGGGLRRLGYQEKLTGASR
ncbi:hypothetical protein Ancab_012628 [Ancistrocladus abbreviatus]